MNLLHNVDRVRDQVRLWRDELINLSRRDRVLYFRPTKSATLLIEQPGFGTVLTTLMTWSRGWDFYLPPDPPEMVGAVEYDGVFTDPIELRRPKPTELVTQKPDRKQVESALRTLERRTKQEFMDRGIWVLYLACGFLRWIDPDTDNEVKSPLLLVPVELTRKSPREPHRLIMAEEEPVVNPALVVKMENDFGVELPPLDEIDSIDTDDYLRQVERSIVDRPWAVTKEMAIDVFSFHKEVMYKDLKENEDAICSSELIRALALGSETDTDLGFPPPTEEDLDALHPPEEMATILDSDGSQRRCIVSASNGHSFVMDGPPGTGKSQTIANMISQAVYEGRTVLFVSEKIAALEVVKARLEDAGLAEYLLELHSHKTARRKVAHALYKSLGRYPRASTELGDAARQKLISIRLELTSYAEAVNEIRAPLGRSLHSVIGRASHLHGTRRVSVPSAIDENLEVHVLQKIIATAQALSRAWSPVQLGDDFLWRGVDRRVASMGGKRATSDHIEEALQALEALESEAHHVSTEFELWWDEAPRAASKLLRVLAHLEDRRSVPPHWLTSASLDAVVNRADELRILTDDYSGLVSRVNSKAGDGWRTIDHRAAELVRGTEADLGARGASSVLDGQMDASELRLLVRFFSEGDAALTEIARMARTLAGGLGLDSEPLTLGRIDQLVALTDLLTSGNRPEGEWLDPLALPRLDEATSVLNALVDSYRAKAEALSSVFKPPILDLDLETLQARFATLHKGIRKLGAAYRADKELLATETRTGKVTDETIAALPSAIEWQRLAAELSAAEDRHAGLLGDHYYRGPETDFESIAEAIDIARRAVDLAGRRLANTSRFRSQLGREGDPDSQLRLLANDLHTATEAFRRQSTELVRTAWEHVEQWSIQDLQDWLRACRPSLEVLHARANAVEEVAGRPVGLNELRRILADRTAVNEIEDSLDRDWDSDRTLLGSAYEAIYTDWQSLLSDIEWTVGLRAGVEAPVDDVTAERLLIADVGSAALASAQKTWQSARDRVTAAFDDSRAATLRSDMEASFVDAAELLRGLAESIELVDDWVAFIDARNTLASLGVAETTEELIRDRAHADEVVSLIERAVLEAWVDSVLSSDERLSHLRSEDRDAFVSEFQELDRRLIGSAASVVMNSANARRPQTNVGAAGLIQKEGQKKRRHLPVRDLISAATEVVQALKPCFMMSPLSVSQFLAPDLRFDMVIFDEASQVKPSDAVNCVYRGRQLVVAGDQKQLPPTTFFEAVSMDGGGDEYEEGQFDEFESVLDLAKAGGMESLPLRWHYRSQHESLITYSNYSFYEGGLVTYPGALAEAPDVGLEFFYVNGQYRRGGARDNPIEAEKVAERVLFHAETHPNLTLGVVAFSEAQASTIEYVLDQRRRDRPELDGFFDEHRLTGFFVKNLENVQGDERDIMIFSIGYGPDEVGKITMNFGPLNRVGGQRRLNVAITRARRRVEVVSSLRPSDFQPTTSEGPRHLGRYLDFVDRGMSALALEISDERRDVESPLEEEIVRLLSSWGFDVHPQVGVAEYRIDVAIADPAAPGRYLLGIECDGAMYHSSRVARDRDRIRQQVLESLGWTIHRIWGPAWYRNRSREEERLREAIEASITGKPKTPTSHGKKSSDGVELVEVDFDAPPVWAEEYKVARPRAARWYEGLHDPAARHAVVESIEQVVEVESPVAKEVVLRRVREAWGAGRAGNRIREGFDDALREAKVRQSVTVDRYHFLWDSSRPVPVVRYPSTDPNTQRSISEVAREELELAITNIVRDAHQVTWDELTGVVSRLFGWGRRGPEIARALDNAVRRLEQRGVLEQRQEYVVPGPAAVD